MTNIWEAHCDRAANLGGDPREHSIHNLRQRMDVLLRHSPSFHTVQINGAPRQAAVLAYQKKPNLKKLCALPGETIPRGGHVLWKGSHWLVTQVDADDTVYVSAIMQQCNHILRWNDDYGNRVERWVIVEDGTKYLEGITYQAMMSTGAARIAVTVGKDEETRRLRRGTRFVIADPDAEEKLAYRITKPNTLFNLFEGEGCYRYIMTETVTEDGDNVDELVAGDDERAYPKEVARYDETFEEGRWI